MALAEMVTAIDPAVAKCVQGGVDHDFRIHTYERRGVSHSSWRCVWCHVVACGNVDQPDPCMEPYHHRGDHVAKSGARWPLGGDRNEVS